VAGVSARSGRLQAESGWVFSVKSPRGVRESPQEDGVESFCGSLVESFEKVPIRVKGDLDRRVSQSELDDLRVLALGDEYGCVRVPKVVEPERLTDQISTCGPSGAGRCHRELAQTAMSTGRVVHSYPNRTLGRVNTDVC